MQAPTGLLRPKLKEVSHARYHKLHQFLEKLGFWNSVVDSSLFTQIDLYHTIHVLIYVDDVIIPNTCPRHLQDFIDSISPSFQIFDLGNLSYFLRLETMATPISLLTFQIP